MAATFRTSAAGGGTSGTVDRTAAITAAVGDLLIVFASTSGNTNASPTCSDDQGGSYDLIGTALFGSSANIGSVFVRRALCTSAVSHTVTVATGSNTAGEIVVVAYAGMAKKGSAAVRSQGSQANQAASTTPTPVLNQAALTSNPTITCVFNSTAAASVAVPNASWTERQDQGQSTPTTGIEVATRDSGFTSTSIAYGGTSSTAFASFAIELDSSNSGSAALTLGALTASSAGTVSVSGSASLTLDALTEAGSATVAVQGSSAQTLGALSVSGAGTVASTGITGSASLTLGALTASAAGTVAVTGSAALTLGGLTDSSAGTVAVTGAGTSALGALSTNSTGTVAVVGNGAVALGLLSVSGSGTVAVAGAGSVSLGAVSASGAGAVAISANAADSLGPFTVSGSGVVGNPPVTADASLTLGALSVSGSGAVGISAAGNVAVSLSATGSAAALVTGSGGVSLELFTVSAAGTVVDPPQVVDGNAEISAEAVTTIESTEEQLFTLALAEESATGLELSEGVIS